MSVGRPPGRTPTTLEQAHLKLLLELRERAQMFARDYDDRIAAFVLELREEGCSARSLAEAMGVSSSTIQAWTTAARRRRNSG